MPYSYTAFGLKIRSEIELPMAPATFERAEVEIKLGPTPSSLDAPERQGLRFEAKAAEFLLQVDGVARYWVRNGNEILIDKTGSKNGLSDVSLFLTSSAFGALLHQRGTSGMHASAAVWNDGCILIAGRSGAGKSTLLTALNQAGFRRFCDDICPVKALAGQAFALPGTPSSKLWPDSLLNLGYNPEDYERVRPSAHKRVLPWNAPPPREALPVKAVFFLNLSRPPLAKTRRLTPIQAFGSLREHTYRRQFLIGPVAGARHFRAISLIAQTAPAYLVNRSESSIPTTSLVDELLRHLKEIETSGA